MEGALASALSAPPSTATDISEGSQEAAGEANVRALCGLLLAVDRYGVCIRITCTVKLRQSPDVQTTASTVLQQAALHATYSRILSLRGPPDK